MLKRLLLLLLEFGAGLAGNLAAGWIQQDAWDNLFTPTRLVATLAGAALMLLLIAGLESERALAWNWRWHRFWYLRALARHSDLCRWEQEFARLHLAHGRRLTTTEVAANDERGDMVELLWARLHHPDPAQRRALVLGEPGSGKSTGLERLAWQSAHQGARRLGWGWRLPVLARLGNYPGGDLLAFAAEEMQRLAGGRSAAVLSRGFTTLLAQGRILLLYDALDETLGERRIQALTDLANLLQDQRYATVPLVVTARTREDPGERLSRLPAYTLQDLSDAAVRAFVQVYRPDDPAGMLQRLQAAHLLEPGGLGRNPFWLRLMAASQVFQGRKGEILLQAIADLLAREWDKPPAERAGWQRRLPRDQQLAETQAALAWLAHAMSQAGVVALSPEEATAQLTIWLRDRPAGLPPADILGLGRDAQLLVYWAGPIRFRHRLLQEALTAWHVTRDAGRLAATVAAHADDVAWWETLLMAGHLTDEPERLAQAILGDGDTIIRLWLAVGVGLSGAPAAAPLRQTLLTALGRALAREGVNDAHRQAVGALAGLLRDDVIQLLVELLGADDPAVGQAALDLLRTLDALSDIFFGSHTALLPRLMPGLKRLEEAAGRPILLDLTPMQRRLLDMVATAAPLPGAGVVLRDGVWLPDIVWGRVVSAGRYPIGDNPEADSSFPAQTIPIPQPYQLARYPITCLQFQCFPAAVDFDDPRWWAGMPEKDWFGPVRALAEPRSPLARHPRDNVTWYQATAFCRWLSQQLGYTVELPHEHEWEVAARYPDGRVYPWGNTFDPARSNTEEGGVRQTTPVGAYPAGAQPVLELDDLSGNVWEWCRNKHDALADTAVDDSNEPRVVRGGSWADSAARARATCRLRHHPCARNYAVGLRVVRRLPSHDR